MIENSSARFELVVQVRDNLGQPTGQTRIIKTNSAEELDGFFERHNPDNKKKKRKKTKKSTNNTANKVLKNITKLKGLKEGWDGNKAKEINVLLLEHAEQVITSIKDLLKFQPKVIALENTEMDFNPGGIQLLFQNFKTHKELEINFVHIDYIKCLYFDPSTKGPEEIKIPYAQANKIRSLVQQVIEEKNN